MAIEKTVTSGNVDAAQAAGNRAETGERSAEKSARGIAFRRHFTMPGTDPFDAVEWETRDAVIGSVKGETVFEQKGV